MYDINETGHYFVDLNVMTITIVSMLLSFPTILLTLLCLVMLLYSFLCATIYINVRRSRDCLRSFAGGLTPVRSSFVVAVIQFTLGSFYADCPHKRIT